jgi:protocatechuate 3,4-dioxygenase alpha subunit
MPVEHLKETPSQTAGPYLHIGMLPAQAGLKIRSQEKLNVMTSAKLPGEKIRIEGMVYDGSGAPVYDAQIEIWQADSKGVYNAPGFLGWGRAGADFKTGLWYFETIKPGVTLWANGAKQAPHISALVFARGINIALHTRIYFEDEDNAKDPVLKSIEQVALRDTLVAKKVKKGVYRFDIYLQGDKETVFFDI